LPDDVWARESAVKELMLDAVRPAGAGRPSVEAPLHEALDWAYVVHLHPALVNGMTCSMHGRAVCKSLFPDAMWVDYVDPGCTLARHIGEQLRQLREKGAAQPQMVFLQSHGVFVAADSLHDIRKLYQHIMKTLQRAYRNAGIDTELDAAEIDRDAVMQFAPKLRGSMADTTGRMPLVHSSGWFAVAEGPLTPDHIVYAKSFPMLTDDPGPVTVKSYSQEHGCLPVVTGLSGRAVFAAGASLKEARGILVAARDAARVQQLTHAFGGPQFLSATARRFIEEWEVEAYRRKVAGETVPARLAGKVCVVTGAAQGFGLGIAEGMAANGGVIGIADLNMDGAMAAVRDMEERFGQGCAFAVDVNVADEESVANMLWNVTRECGGLDVFIANAGVLRAAPLKEMMRRDWQLVTDVNYTGYFLSAKYAAQVMAVQNQAAGGRVWTDIIQINSKSGLEGSSRNAAYAGGKFGGIGLTQSFAKELVTDCIKVNSICPGNFFDGPLWSDPDKGLFVQYLQAGKVPGAATVEDVRRFYEAKIPLGRGCMPEDVLVAVLYAVEQKYETGQAIPVTGGQVMLH
jgi:NAD(P)-dependent dehydrogenase (short-subunit alcohol dehydrogenase family)/rhamnose utilization protein RhaD (predicted bifunctional aldolase and dehydrogenase)